MRVLPKSPSPPQFSYDRESFMIVIAVDPHKSSHTALAVDPAGRELGQLRVEARAHRRLLRWARPWPERRWAVEGARGLGHGLSQWLLTEGESVVDVPARLVARVRLLSAGGKSDPADARAIALAAQPLTALRAVRAEDDTAVLRLRSDRRDELTQERTRVVNRLHRLLRELRPGRGPSRLSADRAQALLRRLRPTGAADRERLRMARELVREVRVLDRNLVANGRRLEAALRVQGSALTRIPGVGVILAAKIVGRSGAVSRFPSRAHYASYTGTAPLEVSSGEIQRHRLSRGGDRQLNRALHIVALTQAHAGHRRPRLLPSQTRRWQESKRGVALPQTPTLGRRLPMHGGRCSHLRYRGRLTQRLRPTGSGHPFAASLDVSRAIVPPMVARQRLLKVESKSTTGYVTAGY